jgi:hypothetical protein
MVMKIGWTTRKAAAKTISVTRMAMRPARQLAGGNPGGGRRGGFVAPEEAAEGEGVRQGEEDAGEEQINGEELDGDVVAEVVEDHVGDDEGGEEGSSERGAAIEEEDAAENLR